MTHENLIEANKTIIRHFHAEAVKEFEETFGIKPVNILELAK